MIWFDKCVERIYTQVLIEIRNVINNAISTGRYWSKWVDKVWDENYDYVINLNFSVELTDVIQNIFIIWDGHFKNEIWKVTYHDDRPPECECGIFFYSKVSHYFVSNYEKKTCQMCTHNIMCTHITLFCFQF